MSYARSMSHLTRLAYGLRSTRIIPRVWSYSRCFSKPTHHKDYFDFGDYSLILPAEPYVFGVSHIVPRSVPSSIVQPNYVLDDTATLDAPSTDKDQKIVLGGSSEFLIRRVARLAKTVREYAGKLVQVRLAILFERGGL
jgi:methionyl aminopeptidase